MQMAKPTFNPRPAAERAKLRKFADLKPGLTYVVSREIVNPHGDRRAKGDWRRAATVPAGTRLYAITNGNEIWLEPFERDVPVMPGAASAEDEKAVDLYYELLGSFALEPAEKETTIDLLRASSVGISGHDVLMVLGREKLVEPTAIREALVLILSQETVPDLLSAIDDGVTNEQLLEALVAMETISVDDVKLSIEQITADINAKNAKAEEEQRAAEEAAKTAEMSAPTGQDASDSTKAGDAQVQANGAQGNKSRQRRQGNGTTATA
jgi:hypothetical protein